MRPAKSAAHHLNLRLPKGLTLQPNVHVLICKHIAEGTYDANGRLAWSPGGAFVRVDGSKGAADFMFACPPCTGFDAKRVDYIEYFWNSGTFHCCDSHPGCVHEHQ